MGGCGTNGASVGQGCRRKLASAAASARPPQPASNSSRQHHEDEQLTIQDEVRENWHGHLRKSDYSGCSSSSLSRSARSRRRPARPRGRTSETPCATMRPQPDTPGESCSAAAITPPPDEGEARACSAPSNSVLVERRHRQPSTPPLASAAPGPARHGVSISRTGTTSVHRSRPPHRPA